MNEHVDASAPQRAGWQVRDWCKIVGICTATFYNLDDAQRPSSVKIRDRRLIIEAPAAYLQRVSEMQRRAA